MKHWITYPLIKHPYDPAFVSKDALVRFARTAEAAGFDGIGFTDHPAPSDRWLQAGGHDALDPFAALAFIAAVTDRLLLIPNILVLPYRNPFLVAKAVATIDALSGGRFVLATATGYQRAEYAALGVDFEQRNVLFDEALAVLRGVWTTDDFAYEGTTFSAQRPDGQPQAGAGADLDRREQPDGPGPGGHRRRRLEPVPGPRGPGPHGQDARCWRPSTTWPACSTTCGAGSAKPAGIRRRSTSPSRPTAGGSPDSDAFDADAHRAGLDELAALGMTWNGVGIPGDSLEHALETLERYGEQVIGPSRQGG